MTVTHTFVATRSHERFRITALASSRPCGGPYVELVVEDAEAQSSLKLIRPELMPLLGAVKEALKDVEDGVAGLPRDPVERAAFRVPHSGLATSLHRADVLKAYRQEMAQLQERFIQRFDDAAERLSLATDPHVPAPTKD